MYTDINNFFVDNNFIDLVDFFKVVVSSYYLTFSMQPIIRG